MNARKARRVRGTGNSRSSGRVNKFTGYDANYETLAEREARLDKLVEAFRKANNDPRTAPHS